MIPYSPQRPSFSLSQLASRTIGQAVKTSAPQTPIKAFYVSTGIAAALGIAYGVIPKKQKTWKKVAMSGSVIALAITAVLFTLGD